MKLEQRPDGKYELLVYPSMGIYVLSQDEFDELDDLCAKYSTRRYAEIARLKRELEHTKNLLRTSGGKTNG